MRLLKLSPIWLHALAFALPGMLLAAVWTQDLVSIHDLFRDPLDVALGPGHSSVHFGLMSNLGVLLWCGGAAICGFACLQCHARGRPRRDVGCLAAAAIIGASLMLDDMFLGHEIVMPQLAGIEEKYVLLIHALAVAVYLLVFSRVLLGHENSFLVVALALFAISVATDLLWHEPTRLRRLAEDGTKFLGIAAWAAYHVRLSWLLTRPSPDRPG